MAQAEYFHQAFATMERLGPGSAASTCRAAAFYPNPLDCRSILDIGCGTGAHTLLLAQKFPNAQITAIDIYQPHIAQLNRTAQQMGIADRVHGKVMDMFKLKLPPASFDLLWAEGAIYIIGFEQGLRQWRQILKPNGWFICSDLCWLHQNPSAESRSFWETEYPEIALVDQKQNQIRKAGYLPQKQFICPVSDWTDHYYTPLQKNLSKMRDIKNPDAMQVVRKLQTEIDLYRQHPQDYSYVFFGMQKTGGLK